MQIFEVMGARINVKLCTEILTVIRLTSPYRQKKHLNGSAGPEHCPSNKPCETKTKSRLIKMSSSLVTRRSVQ